MPQAGSKTEALSAEIRRLRAERDRYRDTYDASPDMIVSVDPETATIVDCNRRVSERLGWSKEALEGRSIFDVYDESCHEDVEAAFQVFRATGSLSDVSLRVMHADGGALDVLLSVSAIRDTEGNIVRSVSTWRVAPQTKELLKLAEMRLALALKGAGVAMWDWNLQTNELRCDMSLFELFDVPYDPAPGSDVFVERMHPEDQSRVAGLIEDAIERCGTYDARYRIVRKDGDVRLVHAVGIVLSEDCVPTWFSGAIIDLTEECDCVE